PFLGRDLAAHPDYSEHVAAEIDAEIRRLIDEAHDEAWEILTGHGQEFEEMVARLIEKESVEKEEVEAIFAEVPKRASRGEAISRPRRRTEAAAAIVASKPDGAGGGAEARAGNEQAPARPAPKPRPGAEPAPA
ncbi:MAG: ATP-dependent zinc metalloprotease FtsH, partial [Acidimicrobiales bacterium]